VYGVRFVGRSARDFAGRAGQSRDAVDKLIVKPDSEPVSALRRGMTAVAELSAL
jgi:hypothetical protein